MSGLSRKATIITVSAIGVAVIGFLWLFGPPGLVDIIGAEEVEPGVIEVSLLCHNDVDDIFTWSFEGSLWVFAMSSNPDRYSPGRDDCLSSARIDLGEPLGGRRLIDGFDLSTVGPLP